MANYRTSKEGEVEEASEGDGNGEEGINERREREKGMKGNGQ